MQNVKDSSLTLSLIQLFTLENHFVNISMISKHWLTLLKYLRNKTFILLIVTEKVVQKDNEITAIKTFIRLLKQSKIIE